VKTCSTWARTADFLALARAVRSGIGLGDARQADPEHRTFLAFVAPIY
jgi:hypothetical protein